MSDKSPGDLTDFETSEPSESSDERLHSRQQDPDDVSQEPGDLQQQLADLQDRWLRSQAELQNMRRRFERERQEIADRARAGVLKEILLVVDSCEQGIEAIEQEPTGGELAAYHEGLKLLLKGLQGVLARFNVSEVPGLGHSFDPTLHEAVLTEETDRYADGEVIEIYRKGYQMKDRLLRPAQVKVASSPA